MIEYNEAQDLYLFEWDLSEYQKSDEGRAVQALIEYNDHDQLTRRPGVTPAELKKAFESYWDARNATGLHYDGKLAE